MKMINASSNGSTSKELFPFDLECIFIQPGSVNFTIFYLTNIVVMFPICVLILYLGLQQWWQQRSTSTAAMMGHSDVFMYHLVVMELVGVLGCILCCVGIQDWRNIFIIGYYFWNFPWYGEALFHILTCVERYLAVVHPINYLSSRRERGIRIRNISIGCVWLLCFILTSLVTTKQTSLTANVIVLVFATVMLSFCSISVLCVLIRPGPGDKSGNRGMSNQSKMKAFYIVMVILGVVSIRFLCNIAWIFVYVRSQDECPMINVLVWFNLPSTLVLPLLFLHRSQLLTFCINKKVGTKFCNAFHMVKM